MYWDSFDCEIQCEEVFEERYDEDLIDTILLATNMAEAKSIEA